MVGSEPISGLASGSPIGSRRPLIVGSEHNPAPNTSAANASFNPTMVRLLHGTRFTINDVGKLSIPQWCDCCTQKCRRPFTKIALSIPQWCDCCEGNAASFGFSLNFQSHNGAIAAGKCYYAGMLTRGTFQSHNGAIAAKYFFRIESLCLTFNPTMVRLLRAFLLDCKSSLISFQSHNGAIAACGYRLPLTALCRFQSHNGAIAARH